MSLLESIFEGLAKTSRGKNKFHLFKGKSGSYLKYGSDSNGRKGKTLWWKKK